MRITFAVALVAILSSSALAQESQDLTEADVKAPVEAVQAIEAFPVASDNAVSTESALISADANTNIVEPVLYQEGIAVEGATEGAVDGMLQGSLVTEPLSVVSGGVIDSAPIMSEGAPMDSGYAPMADGGMITDGGAIMGSAPAMSTPSCGCGGNAVSAPMVSAPMMSAPMVSAPMISSPMVSAPAPVMTYSSPPVRFSAPVSRPCCNQRGRGFFRSMFRN